MEIALQIIGIISHYLLPMFAFFIVVFTFLSLFSNKNKFTYYLLLSDSNKIELNLKDTLLGSSGDTDIRLHGCDKEHAVICIKRKGVTIRALRGKTVFVNNKKINGEVFLNSYDTVSLGSCEFFVKHKASTEKSQKNKRSYILSLFSLFAFQFILFLQMLFLYGYMIAGLFFVFIVFEIIYFAVVTPAKFTIETVVFFLLTLGYTVVADLGTVIVLKQIVTFAVGFVFALLIYFVFVSKRLVNFLKIFAVIFAFGLFAANVIIGVVYNGSQNWIEVGSYSFQPSEFVKIALVFLSAVSAEKIKNKYNTVGYTLFVVFSLLVLAYLRDFGTAFVYATVFLVVIMLRNCSWRTFFAYVVSGGVLMGIISLLLPYITKRMFSFGNAWENAFTSGYQQTRTLIAAASGGLLGVGTSNGFLRTINSFDTDIVFGLICEELGIIVGVCVVLSFVFLTFYSVKLFDNASPFCSIPACAAATLFLTQMSLNVFGSFDMLPFTGVTIPFISNGGSSLICCVALIGFFKAAEREASDRYERKK